jgi:HD-GYP domain-containing protein (c-di-GMP phosphodiesterase class II)/HAMP domain-containing protein
MKIDKAFLRSKVGRRIFVLFILCALIPMTMLAIVSYRHVVRQVSDQSRKQLSQTNKAVGMAIIERLSLLESQLKMIALNYNSFPDTAINSVQFSYSKDLEKWFGSIAILTDSEEYISLLGSLQNRVRPSPAGVRHMQSGKPLLVTSSAKSGQTQIVLMIAMEPTDIKRGIMVGVINPGYLWNIATVDLLPFMAEVIVFNHSGNIIYSSHPVLPSFLTTLQPKLNNASWGEFEWRDKGISYTSSLWPVFLKFQFLSPKWAVVMTLPQKDLFAHLTAFKWNFTFIILISLWVVLLLSLIQIRRSLVPLERLKEGTERIARRDFSSPVAIASNDEFGELAESFNTMASNINDQFNTLTTIAEIDRAILAEQDMDKLASAVITRMPKALSCDFVGIGLVESDTESMIYAYSDDGNPGSVKKSAPVPLTPDILDKCRINPEGFMVEREEDLSACFRSFAANDYKVFSVMPVFVHQELSAVMITAFRDFSSISFEGLTRVRQIADQVAVALMNAKLIEDLHQLTQGTLASLGRAIDAKSSWTGGHSERVAHISVKIGKALGLSRDELVILFRSGLLHDVGMIGIPSVIIDKSGKLTEDEFQKIREHPHIGVKILEPMSTHEEIIANVVQHHERYDGKGYPSGLAGEEIGLSARILAVADTFDALKADRPHRAGIELERIVAIIREESGKQFDPTVVEAFLKIIEEI